MGFQLGALIRDYRENKKMTQLELANRLGYESMQFISLFERGISKVPKKVIGKLVIILKIPQRSIVNALVEDFKQDLIEQIEEGKKEYREPL